MKRILSVSLLLLLSLSLFSIEIGFSGTLSNMDFSPDRKETETKVSGTDYLYGLSVFSNADVAEDLTLEAGVFYDPILRYTLSSRLTYRSDYFQFSAGPFFGIFNDWSTVIKPGIATEILIDVPGFIFTRLSADSSIGGRLIDTGEYLQERSQIGVGFYVPNAICEISMETKNFTEKTSYGELVDKLLAYTFNTDIYQKNRPYRFDLSFSYQTRNLSFIGSSDTIDHTLNSLVLGTGIDVQASRNLDIFLNLESNIYSFGEADNTFMEYADSGIGIYLFSLSTGLRFRVD